jgi:membrane-associated phospholipid phosphatase
VVCVRVQASRFQEGAQMTNRTWMAAAAVLAVVASAPAEALSKKDWATVSDVGAAGLGALALGVPLLKDDNKGFWQAAGSLGAATAVSEGLSLVISEERPDGSGNDSFPSSHAAFAFAAAATLHKRYGWQWGLPATAGATLVAIARVQSDKHHWYDALAGAAIGEASGFLITSRSHPNVQLTPWADSSGGGVSLAARF